MLDGNRGDSGLLQEGSLLASKQMFPLCGDHCLGTHSPACCMADPISKTLHSSLIFPALKRNRVIPGTVILLPVAGKPMPCPVLVPNAVQYTTTMSRSASIWLTWTCMSCKALRCSLARAVS